MAEYMILEYNLQFFAADGPGGEKTEEPTQKRKTDNRKEGKVCKSQEVNHAFELIAVFILLKIVIGHLGTQFMEVFKTIYSKIPEMVTFWEGNIIVEDYATLIHSIYLKILVILAPFLATGFIVAFLVQLVQVKWVVSWKPMKPKFSKLNPISGVKRIFSAQKLFQLGVSVVKIVLISWVVYDEIKDAWKYLFIMYDIPLTQGIELVGNTVINLGLKISLFFLIVAAADYFYQKMKFQKDSKMTKQEVKDEYKQQEGDPQIKSKIRSKMQEVSRRRMMQNLPDADVVITNPTHFAVAIKYDTSQFEAPFVVAKGADHLAFKIKEVAKENHIEIVENKPLARMLYANVEVGEQIPPELYQTVAEILAMVYKMQGKI